MWQAISYYAVLMLESVAGVVGLRLYEEPAYVVTDHITDRIEIRRYAPRLAAEVALTANGDAARSQAFRLLFDYISGANRSTSGGDKIAMTVPVEVRDTERLAMTAPVESAQSDGAMRMRFFLPQKYSAETAPQPLDQRVQLIEIPAQTIATLRYSGSGKDFAAREKELIAALERSRFKPSGQPYTLFYDAPFTPSFLRRNEAAVAVDAAIRALIAVYFTTAMIGPYPPWEGGSLRPSAGA